MRWWQLLVVTSVLASVSVLGHELDLHWGVQGDSLVIEAESEGEPAVDARVAVRSADGKLLAEGKTDGAGVWTWRVSRVGEVQVEVDAGYGHHEDVRIVIPAEGEGGASAEGVSVHSHVDGMSGTTADGLGVAWRVGLGLALLLSFSAAWMSWGNTRRIRALEAGKRDS